MKMTPIIESRATSSVPKRILMPLDEATFAETALTYLPRFIEPAQTEVVLLSVLETMGYAATAYQYAPLMMDEICKNYAMYLQTMQQWLGDHGYVGFTKLAKGEAEQILAVAQKTNANLFAITTLPWPIGCRPPDLK